MWLLDVDSLELREFLPGSLPPYTILSHTWGPEEVTFRDFHSGGVTGILGLHKIKALCDRTRLDGFNFTWIDTCCIDKSNSTELSEAINSMYRWYAEAAICYVYLSDIRYSQEEEMDVISGLRHSKWFTRSWTLQELIAPPLVTFFDVSWHLIGTKKSLLDTISDITGIPRSCLSGEMAPVSFSVAARFSWASKRICMREEDIAYSLMGIFDINMAPLYGEGEKAFVRLQEEIFRKIDDQSILAWGVSKEDSRFWTPSSIFAKSPADFADAAAIYQFDEREPRPPILTHRGLYISLPLIATPVESVVSISKHSSTEDFPKIHTAYLSCGPDTQHAVQIILMSAPFSSNQSSPATFHRLASPLTLIKRRRDLQYKDIYISTRIDSLLRSNWAIPSHETRKSLSFSTHERPMHADSVEDKNLADFGPIEGRVKPRETILDAIVDILTEQMVPNVAGKLFLPEGTLNKLLDEDIMLRLVHDMPQPPGSTARAIEHTVILPRFRKIFAILALSGLLRFFRTIVDELEIRDEYLPMPDPESLFNTVLVIATEDAEHMARWKSVAIIFGRKVFVRTFFDTQWCVLAPIFRSSNHIQHYSLSQHHILPFVRSAPHTLERETMQTTTSFFKFGGYGEIRKVCIHPDHYEFGPVPGDNFVCNRSNFFAVKEIRGTDRESFETEKHALERFAKPNSPNILRLLATYEVRANYADYMPTTYNMLFPWADGNLKELWSSDEYTHNEGIVPWMAEQCWKLAHALKVIHMGFIDNTSDIQEPERFYGIHGDIKPANILRFAAKNSENPGQLVIGDFGLTHFHHENSRSIVSSSNVSVSMTYSAPEFVVDGKLSRKADLWALGCVFLEFIIWFLKGPDSVSRRFPDPRFGAEKWQAVPSDRFFQVNSHDDGRPPLARVKPVVLDWVNMLYNSEGSFVFIKHFLVLIRFEMLTVNQRERIGAEGLSRKLEEMYHKCLYEPHALLSRGQYSSQASGGKRGYTFKRGAYVRSPGIREQKAFIISKEIVLPLIVIVISYPIIM